MKKFNSFCIYFLNFFLIIMIVLMVVTFVYDFICYGFSINNWQFFSIDNQDDITNSISAVSTAAAAAIAGLSYAKHVDDEKPRKKENVTSTRVKGKDREFIGTFTILNNSSLPSSYALKGLVFSKDGKISKDLMRHTEMEGNKGAFKIINKDKRNVFINIGPRQALEICTISADFKVPITSNYKYLHLVVEDFGKDIFSFDVETEFFDLDKD